MVRQKEISLFKDLIGGLDFNKYHFPEFNPSFVHLMKQLATVLAMMVSVVILMDIYESHVVMITK